MKSPAFQIYPADFLADKNTLVMTAAEVGAYWLLLCVCWRENGLTDDIQELADLARTPVKQFQVSWERKIQRCFVQRTDGKWTHNRLEKEREKQAENREKRKSAGEKGAKAKWQTDSNAIARPSTGSLHGNGNALAKDSLSSSSSISSSTTSSPSGEKKEHPAKKQQDERSKHPALVAVREVKGKFPTKDVWDLVISSVGAHPDVPKMRDCWLAWRTRNYQPENLGWLVDWYVNGIPANGSQRAAMPSGLAAAERVAAKYEQRS